MVKKSKGRPSNRETSERNADRVFLQLARDRSLAGMGDLGGKNPLSGRKLKGQHRLPRSFTKEVLPKVAEEIRALPKKDQENLSPRTLERHYQQFGTGALKRVVAEIHGRLNKSDKAREEMAKVEAEKRRPIIEKLNRRAKALQRRPVRRLLREK